jgi:IclR family transcriptional regulator, acetate operon repressor
MQNDKPAPTYPIASVDNALTLLSLIAERDQVRVSEAAEVLGTARSTAHRLLAMLDYHGFAAQDEVTKTYAAGPQLIKVGLSAVEGLSLRQLARPVLERLCDEVSETTHLVRLFGTNVVFLDSVETTRGLRVGSRIGRFMYAHCTACGKAILAQLSHEELERLYPGRKLEQMTPRSVATLDELEKELEQIRRRGYATNFGESEDDLVAVAAAVPNLPRTERAAITVAAPSTRIHKTTVKSLGQAVQRGAAEIGATAVS